MSWKQVNVRGERWEQVQALAKSERRSVAQMVDLLLERALAGAGSKRSTASGAVKESREFDPPVAPESPAPASALAQALNLPTAGDLVKANPVGFSKGDQAKGRRA